MAEQIKTSFVDKFSSDVYEVHDVLCNRYKYYFNHNLRLSGNYETIADFDKAMSLLNDEEYYFTFDEVLGRQKYYWSEILEYMDGRLLEYIYQYTNAADVRQTLDNYEWQDSDHPLRVKKYFGKYYSCVVDYMDGMLKSCITSRALEGRSNIFYEKIFEIIRSGGFPCGWSGTWSDGDFIVFKPVSS